MKVNPAKILELYQQGFDKFQIAADQNISVVSVVKVLKSNGIRPANATNRKYDYNKIGILYLAGLRIKRIAELCKMGHQAVSQVIYYLKLKRK